MVIIRLPFCVYNLAQYVELIGEDLTCYSNKIKLISLRRCSRDHWLTNKAYLSAMRVTDISRSSLPTRWRQKSTGIDTRQNNVIITLCIVVVKGLTALRLFISFSQLKIYYGAGYVLFVELVVSSLTTKVIINANLFGLFFSRNK